jgi:hypothetical protein
LTSGEGPFTGSTACEHGFVTESSVTPVGDSPEATSLTLLQRARAGSDQTAWNWLVSLYEPLVSTAATSGRTAPQLSHHQHFPIARR